MNKILCVFVLLISATANAAVVDSFKCDGKIVDLLTGEKASSTNSFDVLRKSVLNGPAEADMHTLGNSSLNLSIATKNYQISANLQISYEHAARTTNGIIDARQSDCTVVTANVCETSERESVCNDIISFCLSQNDPFDPLNGWTKVPFINGAPAFDSRLMRADKGVIKNDNGVVVGNFSYSCTHTGTSIEQ